MTNNASATPNSARVGGPTSSRNKVRKAVLPAAGLGTRFLPATKAQPKEMLTVVDKPQIQYVAEECVASGIEHIIIVTGKGKNSIEDHFDSAPALERFLEERGKKDQAEMVRKISNMVQVSYTRQKEPLGLGHAVLVARDLVGDEPFAVLLGDVLIPGPNPATKQLIKVYEATGVGAIAVEEVPKDKTNLYGIVDGEPAPQPEREYREYGDRPRSCTRHGGAHLRDGSDHRRAAPDSDPEAPRRARPRLRFAQHRLAPRAALRPRRSNPDQHESTVDRVTRVGVDAVPTEC